MADFTRFVNEKNPKLNENLVKEIIVANDRIKGLKKLVIKYPNILNDNSNLEKYTLLHLSTLFSNFDLAEYLIQLGAKTNVTNKIGFTPLDYVINEEKRKKLATIKLKTRIAQLN